MSQAWSDPYGLAAYLVKQDVLEEEEREMALEMSAHMGDPVRYTLVACDILTWEGVYRHLAAMWDLEYVDMAEETIDRTLSQQAPAREALRRSALPFRMDGGVLHVAIHRSPSADLKHWLDRIYEPDEFRFYVASRWDLDRALSKAFREDIQRESVRGQWEQAPEESAYTVLTRPQFLALIGLLMGSITLLYYLPRPTLIALNILISFFFIVSIGYKLWASLGGGLGEEGRADVQKQAEALEPEECPTYTVLVPVYMEANVIEDLVASLLRMDYPKTKMEIIVLMEEEDEETIAAIREAGVPDHVRHIVVPEGTPQTKPRACNVGLWFSEGERLVIYDAEDRPEADQLRKAAALFQQSEERVVCIQCALNYYNTYENFLTRMFTLEYTFWYDYLLPGLMEKELPIPLGGTSNHFRTEVLEELGGWDPFNVTEDADLGIRATMHRMQVKVLRSTTYEEANKAYGNWIRQRSRWIKGYMQTFLVHTRHPIRMIRSVGGYEAMGFLLMVGGGPLAMLLSPIMWGFFVLWIVTGTQAIAPYFPPPLLFVPMIGLLWGNMMGIYLNLLAAFRRDYYRLAGYALLNPVYWLLQSVAAYKALFQLFYKPFYWEKTSHGLTEYDFTP